MSTEPEVTVTASENLEPPTGPGVPGRRPPRHGSGHGDAPEPPPQTPPLAPGRRVSISPVLVIGVDPGETTGIAYVTWYPKIGWSSTQKAFQVPAERAVRVILDIMPALVERGIPWIIATEQFVHRRRSGRTKSTSHARVPTELNRALAALGEAAHWRVRTRRKVDVNEWASQERLEAAHLWEPTRGKRHARDAAQHGLYAAVHDGYAQDPLLAYCEECRLVRPLGHDHGADSADA